MDGTSTDGTTSSQSISSSRRARRITGGNQPKQLTPGDRCYRTTKFFKTITKTISSVRSRENQVFRTTQPLFRKTAKTTSGAITRAIATGTIGSSDRLKDSSVFKSRIDFKYHGRGSAAVDASRSSIDLPFRSRLDWYCHYRIC